uniref:Uncharacterized protein n=1 Tax=Mycena chlorophos TaxID=658473 RepID=A0ABQ0LD21_MYCCL|nr:predicted protein [Mycena chlorophos]
MRYEKAVSTVNFAPPTSPGHLSVLTISQTFSRVSPGIFSTTHPRSANANACARAHRRLSRNRLKTDDNSASDDHHRHDEQHHDTT